MMSATWAGGSPLGGPSPAFPKREALVGGWHGNRRRAALIGIGVALVCTLVCTSCGSMKTHNLVGQNPSQPLAMAKAAPSLQLSRSQAKPGTVIHLTGINCPPLRGQGDELSWHDRVHLSSRGQDSRFYAVQPLTRVGETVTGRYTVRASDHLGRGLFDLLCGGVHGNATAFLTIRR
jgi:hypothetical protein